MSKKRYNHSFSAMFSLNSEHENVDDLRRDELLLGIKRMYDHLHLNPDEIKDSVENVDETLPESVVRVPEKFIVEGAPTTGGLGLCNWGDITKHIKTDPHPEYRLVSVSIINHQSKLVWELL